MRFTRCAAAVVLGAATLLAAGCEDTTASPAERQAIEERVRLYLDRLAEAYSALDASVLEDVATSGEMTEVAALLRGLGASGDRVEAKLLQIEIENVEIFREVNATVTLTEVWDVARYDRYSGVEKAHSPAVVQHSLIQMRKRDGQWWVTTRRVAETEAGSKWDVPTPVPAEGVEVPPEEAAPTGDAETPSP